MGNWAGDFEIRFQARHANKVQGMANRITEFTPASSGNDMPETPTISPGGTVARNAMPRQWCLFVDGSSNRNGSRATLLLVSPNL